MLYFIVKDFVLNEIKLNKISQYLLLAIGLLPLLSLAMVSIAIILFVIGSILIYKMDTTKVNLGYRQVIYSILFLSLPLIFDIISLLWTEDIGRGISIIEKKMPFIIIPLALFVALR